MRWQKSATGNRVQVSPELVEIKESEAPATKWQQPFDASLTDVFQVQSDIAAKVVDSLGVALAEKQEKKLADAPTKNVAAYDAYLKGEEATTVMARADVPALRKGLGYYEQAVALDPKFSEAWARVSTCRALLFTNSVPDPALARGGTGGGAQVDRARAGQARTARWRSACTTASSSEISRARSRSTGRPRSSPRELPIRCARSVAPRCRWAAGRTRSRHYDEAERLDPKNAINVGNSAQPLLYLRRCGEARQAIDRTLALDPDNLSRIAQKVQALLCEGDVAAARALVAETSRRIGPAEAAAYFSEQRPRVAARRRELRSPAPPDAGGLRRRRSPLGLCAGLGGLARG